MSNIEDTKPIDMLSARVWSGTHYHYPHIETMTAELRQLRRENEALRKVAEAAKIVAKSYEQWLLPALKALEAP